MVLTSTSEGFLDALAVGLGQLEERFADRAAASKLVTRPDCRGPRDGNCGCAEAWCVPPISVAKVDTVRVVQAVRTVWPEVVTDVARLDVSVSSVAGLNARLRGAAGLPDKEQFFDQGMLTMNIGSKRIALSPWPGCSNADTTWSTFAELWWEQCQEFGFGEDSWVVSQLAWGGHVPALGLSTGWILASSLRLRHGIDAYAPDPVNAERFLDALDGARPGIWDAEQLRSLWPCRC